MRCCCKANIQLNAFVYFFYKTTQVCFSLNDFIRKYPTGIITKHKAMEDISYNNTSIIRSAVCIILSNLISCKIIAGLVSMKKFTHADFIQI